QIVVYLSPALPQLAADSAALLNASTSQFADARTPTLGHAIGEFKPLMQRVDPKAIEKMLEASQPAPEPAAPPNTATAFEDSRAALDAEPLAEECSIDDFGKVDLRVARVVSAEPVPEANKL